MSDTTVHYHFEFTTETDPEPQGFLSAVFPSQEDAIRWMALEMRRDGLEDGPVELLGLADSLRSARLNLPVMFDAQGFRYSLNECSACSLVTHDGRRWED